jgi:predicted small lipoprotein YifL
MRDSRTGSRRSASPLRRGLAACVFVATTGCGSEGELTAPPAPEAAVPSAESGMETPEQGVDGANLPAELAPRAGTHVETLEERLTAEGPARLAQVHDVTLPDGTVGNALDVLRERASLLDRFDELKEQLSHGGIAPSEEQAMVQELSGVAERADSLTEGLAPRSLTAPALDEAAARYTETALRQLEALAAELDPADPANAEEYGRRKAEVLGL